MTDESIKYNIELKLHTLIVVFNVVVHSVALAMDAFHTNGALVSFCSFALVPTRCGLDPDLYGECDPVIAHRVDIFINIVNIALPAFCRIGIIVTMSLLYRHAVVLYKMAEKGAQTSFKAIKLRTITARDDSSVVNDIGTPQGQVQRLSRLYRRETMIQASCYVGAFSVTYIPLMAGMVLALLRIYPHVVIVIGTFCYPLGGFLNILVYTRPKVASIRRSHPECSRFRGLWMVIKAGGEIPDDIDTLSPCSLCCCCEQWLDESELESESESSEDLPWTIYLFTHVHHIIIL